MIEETELVWTKKGIDYVQRVSDGHLFVRGWKKRRVKVMKKDVETEIVLAVLDRVADVVLNYRPKDKQKKPPKRAKAEPKKEKRE